jgi:hypothetical protein
MFNQSNSEYLYVRKREQKTSNSASNRRCCKSWGGE